MEQDDEKSEDSHEGDLSIDVEVTNNSLKAESGSKQPSMSSRVPKETLSQSPYEESYDELDSGGLEPAEVSER